MIIFYYIQELIFMSIKVNKLQNSKYYLYSFEKNYIERN